LLELWDCLKLRLILKRASHEDAASSGMTHPWWVRIQITDMTKMTRWSVYALLHGLGEHVLKW
jgi:hypothetical protein